MNLDYYKIKQKMESESCPEHHERPEVTLTATGFSLKTCCDNFGNALSTKAEQLVADKTEAAINKMMRDTFK